jgi:Chaperone of endosialidase
MTQVYRALIITGFVLTVGVKPSWGQLPPTNDTSGFYTGSTGGGTGALQHNNDYGGLDYDGIGNTAYGFYALFSNWTALYNTAVGVAALSNSNADDNTASGAFALNSNTTGSDNTASGAFALMSNSAGNFNTASGVDALRSNTIGTGNVGVGVNALRLNPAGNRNIALGPGAGRYLLSGDNNIYLGNFGPATESNTMRLGQTQTATFVAGNFGKPVSGLAVVVNSAGQLGTLPSSARYKRDIHPLGEQSQKLHQLRPVSFRYKQDPQGVKQYGLVAEEVAEVYPELVLTGEQGEIEGVQYQGLIPLLVNEVQHQQRELAAVKAQNATLAAQNAALAARLERLEAAAGRATLAGR